MCRSLLTGLGNVTNVVEPLRRPVLREPAQARRRVDRWVVEGFAKGRTFG